MRLVNVCFDMGIVPMDWCGGRIVRLYKVNDKYEYCKSRCITSVSVVGKLYERVMIKRVRAAPNVQ